VIALLVVLACFPLLSGQAGPEPAREDERLLREGGLATDGPGLLKFFRDRTLSASDRERIALLIAQLNDRTFVVREKASKALIAAGENAIEALRAAVQRPKGEEVRRRAEQCLRTLAQAPHAARAAAAARLLAAHRPEGAADALLGYLPFADWEALSEELLESLAAVGLRGDAPLPGVVAAVADREPSRRAAAAHVLGRAAPEHRKPLVGLLSDSAPLVRYHAAAALTRARDPRGIPTLVALLGEGPADVAWRAEELLGRVAGEKAPLPVPGAPEHAPARTKWHAAWQAWWQANEAGLDLAKVDLGEGQTGLTVVAEIDGLGQFPGRISAFDRGGNLRWSVDGLDSPTDVQCLRAGRVLVAEHWANRVTERDRTGKVLWERKLSNKPVSVDRLRNGNTLMTTYTEILEVTVQGKEVLRYQHTGGMIYSARKLPDGHVLFIDSGGKVTELDAAGKLVRAFLPQQHTNGAGAWASVEPLRGGRYLITFSGSNRVLETDASGKLFWDCMVPSPTYATRLANGNTLVSAVNPRYVVEVDRQGKEVWKKATRGRPFRVRRN
jgi:hypothetical protein